VSNNSFLIFWCFVCDYIVAQIGRYADTQIGVPAFLLLRECPQAFFLAQKHKNTPFQPQKTQKYATPTTGAKDKRHGQKCTFPAYSLKK
jgi:hypothetical protein